MKLEGLLEQDLVLNGPLIGEGRKVGQVHHGSFQIVLVPEEHAQGLFAVVSVLFLGHRDVFLHYGYKKCLLVSSRAETATVSGTIRTFHVRDLLGGRPNQESALVHQLRPTLHLGHQGWAHCLIIAAHANLFCKKENTIENYHIFPSPRHTHLRTQTALPLTFRSALWL